MARGKFNKRGGSSAAGRGKNQYERRTFDDDMWGLSKGEEQNRENSQGSDDGSNSGSDSDSDSAPVQQMKNLDIKKETKKASDAEGEDVGIKTENLNRQQKTHFKASDLDSAPPRELSRREREAKEKKDAQARYWKLHMEGKTDQAKADLARLAAIRKKREEAAAAKKAEAEIKEAETQARNQAKTSGVIKNRFK